MSILRPGDGRISHSRISPITSLQAASADVADKAIDYATRAGDRAADALAHEEAARLYDMALQSLDLKPAGAEADVRRADLHTRRARAFGALAQWAAQKPDLEQARRHLGPEQIERRAELLVELTAASFWLLDLPAVERCAPEALDLADRVQRSDLAANAIAWLAHARSGHGDLTGGIEMGRAAIARAGSARTMLANNAPRAQISAVETARDRVVAAARTPAETVTRHRDDVGNTAKRRSGRADHLDSIRNRWAYGWAGTDTPDIVRR